MGWESTWREEVSRTWVGPWGTMERTGGASRLPEWISSKKNASSGESCSIEQWCSLPLDRTEEVTYRLPEAGDDEAPWRLFTGNSCSWSCHC